MISGLVFPTKHLRGITPPEEFAEEILRIEAELDQVHPTWKASLSGKGGKPGIRGSAGIEKDDSRKARVKWLLQRRKHLYDGKNFDVVVTSYIGRDGRAKMVAHPVVPRTNHTSESLAKDARRSWLKPDEKVYDLNASQLADLLRVPEDRVVRALLSGEPPTGAARLLDYVRSKLVEEDQAGVPEAPRKPKTARKVSIL